MTAGLVALVLIGAVAAAALTDRSPNASRLAKMTASTAVLAVLGTGVSSWDVYAAWVLVALACSWIGDLALSYDTRRAFVVGLGAFATAHLAYIAAFAVRDGFDPAWFAVGAGIMVTVGLVVLRWLSPHRPRELALPLSAYVAIIGLMVAMAFSTHGAAPDGRIPLAAVLFAGSDILVARQQFVVRAPVNRLIGLPMYFVAQVLFALSA